jgi:hypothetical protein
LPLEAALLHLDNDFELHRLSHDPGDAAISRPTTRRVVVVQRIAADDPPFFAILGQNGRSRRPSSCQ